jgi:hypothetical protein
LGESRRKLGAAGADSARGDYPTRNAGSIGASLCSAMRRKLPFLSLSCVLAAVFAGAADLSAEPMSLTSETAEGTAARGRHMKKDSEKQGRKHGERKHPEPAPVASQT